MSEKRESAKEETNRFFMKHDALLKHILKKRGITLIIVPPLCLVSKKKQGGVIHMVKINLAHG